jgi:hypothetical protein
LNAGNFHIASNLQSMDVMWLHAMSIRAEAVIVDENLTVSE